MFIQYHGHSCIQISNNNNSIIIDPYITGNPVAISKLQDIKVQYILITHGHSDHTTDAVAIAKQNNASIIAVEELTTYFSKEGVDTELMHMGGQLDFIFGSVRMTHANHGSSIIDTNGQTVYGGSPVGFLITMDGITIYHAGDTGLFGDMKLLGKLFKIDVAFLPIGGRFTMNPEDALLAAEWLRAGYVVPIHYDTFLPIKQDGNAFVDSLLKKGIQGKAMTPGDIITIHPCSEEVRIC